MAPNIFKILAFGVACISGCSSGVGISPPTAPPRIIGVMPTSISGTSGDFVRLEAQIQGVADSIEWEFGPGAYPTTSRQSTPLVRLARPGIHQLTVTAENGLGGSDPFEIDYSVTVPPVPGWALSYGPDTLEQRVFIAQGRPIVVYGNAGTLQVALARTANPESPTDWTEYSLFAGISFALHNTFDGYSDDGVITLSYPTAEGIAIAQSTANPPLSIGDWQTTVAIPDALLLASKITNYRGAIVLATRPTTTGGNYVWQFFQSSSNAPGTPADWTELPSFGLGASNDLILSAQDGHLLALRENRGGVFATLFSTTAEHPLASDWNESPLPSLVSTPLAVFQAGSATFVVHQSHDLRTGPLGVSYTDSLVPDSQSIWNHYALTADEASGISVAMVDTRPLIIYGRDFGGPPPLETQGWRFLSASRALTPAPTGAADWISTDIVENGNVLFTSVAPTEGGFVIHVARGLPEQRFIRTESLW